MNKADLFWQSYLNIEKSVIELSHFIYITDVKMNSKCVESPYSGQLEVFSPYISDLLVQTCVQIEAVSKELYYSLGGPKPRGDTSIHFDEDCLKEIDKHWDAGNKVVLVVSSSFYLTKEENTILRPLENAHKRGGAYWNRAYQAIKHDRYNSLAKGNLKALLQALAALYLLNLYNRNDTWTTSVEGVKKLNMGLGSKVFAVKQPKVEQLWYGNNPIVSDSPYIVKYKDENYKKIKDIQDEENRALQNYWKSQPELKDPLFQKQLEDAYKRNERVMGIWELCKFRLNKKIPHSLPFEERKRILLNSTEWKSSIHQRQVLAQPDMITMETIDEIIDKLGVIFGMGLEYQYQRMEWVRDAMTKDWCIVMIG